MYSINPNSSEKQLFSVKMKSACYRLYINILIYTTSLKYDDFLCYSVCQFIATVP